MLAEPVTNSALESSLANLQFPPPIMTYICPPEPVPFVWSPVLLCPAAIAALLACMIAISHPWPKTLGLAAILPTLVFAFFGGIHLYRHHMLHTARHAFLRKHPDWAADPLAATLAAEWRRTLRIPRPDVLRKLVPPADACRVLYFGIAESPKFEPAPDEPEIVTPTQRASFSLAHAVGTIAVPFGAWVLIQFGILRLANTTGDGQLIGAVIFAGLIAVLWAWRAGVRPVYIRLAPRMVQFLHYTVRNRPPRIHSYPAACGTIVCVEIDGRLTFLTSQSHDRWNPRWSAEGHGPLSDVLACLYAKTPTPPLSDTDLVG